MNILIYGFGRMGLTHYAILNNLITKSNFTFIEPNKKLTFLLKNNVNVNFYSNDAELSNTKFDLSLITTPPFIHSKVFMSCIKRGDKVIFVEKPFGGHLNHTNNYGANKIYIGYVLRFNPIINWVKENIDHSAITKVYASYKSNTITNKPTGWRNDSYSGVLNEMGSHIIDLSNYLFDLNDFVVQDVVIKSHISDVDDEVSARVNSKSRQFNFYFNWVDKSIRKPVFEFKLEMLNGDKYVFDQQNVILNKNNGKQQKLSVAHMCETVPYYLRGIDFTQQMQDLIGKKKNLCKINDGILVNRIMYEIINYENNLRR